MKTLRRHLNYANVVATFALLFAMSGGALAANHYLVNSTKQINPKVLKKLKGNAGKVGRVGRALALAALALASCAMIASSAQASHTISWGSSLAIAPTKALSAPVDAAYWQQAVAPKAGQVITVTLWGRVASGEETILFQDLRPTGGGGVRVISTTQPFKLTGTAAKRTFRPINFFIHKGDHVGLATIGGSDEVFAAAPGKTTEGFVGAGKDMNGGQFSGSAHTGIELLQRMTERVG
jgi:hypothetical protein